LSEAHRESRLPAAPLPLPADHTGSDLSGSHDHHKGLAHDLQRLLSRREALGVLAGGFTVKLNVGV
jgi:hypothetical protein